MSVKWECTDRMTDIRAPEVSTKFVTFMCMTLFAVVKRKIIGSVFFFSRRNDTFIQLCSINSVAMTWEIHISIKKHCYFMQ